ncbi:hypothetical protein DIPPA_27568 [Diplonema papillatum]|nr:hypothetical protein DIPPA_27568 [Diplonema papillatum]
MPPTSKPDGADADEQKLVCVNCVQEFTEAANYNGACCYHPGAYGRAGLIKKGNGWSCCARESNEKGCVLGRHTTEFEEHHRLIEDMEKIMKRANARASSLKGSVH